MFVAPFKPFPNRHHSGGHTTEKPFSGYNTVTYILAVVTLWQTFSFYTFISEENVNKIM